MPHSAAGGAMLHAGVAGHEAASRQIRDLQRVPGGAPRRARRRQLPAAVRLQHRGGRGGVLQECALGHGARYPLAPGLVRGPLREVHALRGPGLPAVLWPGHVRVALPRHRPHDGRQGHGAAGREGAEGEDAGEESRGREAGRGGADGAAEAEGGRGGEVRAGGQGAAEGRDAAGEVQARVAAVEARRRRRGARGGGARRSRRGAGGRTGRCCRGRRHRRVCRGPLRGRGGEEEVPQGLGGAVQARREQGRQGARRCQRCFRPGRGCRGSGRRPRPGGKAAAAEAPSRGGAPQRGDLRRRDEGPQVLQGRDVRDAAWHLRAPGVVPAPVPHLQLRGVPDAPLHEAGHQVPEALRMPHYAHRRGVPQEHQVGAWQGRPSPPGLVRGARAALAL
mmetsp:Transcript_99878/g.279727  ORF Transcript_99878/g.279727 Transcript_99878/m.279727 type:complete len:392 (-) Transcript_99878:832-2007(-)